jgi:6-phosphogluconolactonase (cycloisomerase 2 family)
MLKKAAALILLGAGFGFCLSCGKTANDFVYAAIPTSNQIAIYREDPNSGFLTQLDDTPIAAGPAVQALALHPSKKFLYAANSGESDISLFNIATDGTLTEQPPRTTVSNGTEATTPMMLAISPNGSYLFVGNAGTAFPSVSVFSINSTNGVLTQISGSPFPIGISPLNMALAPNGNVLYVTGAGSPGYIEAWNVSASTGALSFLQLVQPGVSPYGIAISPNGSYLYTATTGDDSIEQYSIGSGGMLTEITSAIGGLNSPLALLVDNSNSYLYVTSSPTLLGYSIGSNGSLEVLSSSPFATGVQPDTIASDPSGNYLFVGNQSTPVVQSFALATSDGTLTTIGKWGVPGAATSIVVLAQ